MSAVTQMKAVFEGLSGRTLTNNQLESITANYNASWDDEWFVDSNPYDQQTQPTEWANWPGNASASELAVFALGKMYGDTRIRLRKGRGLRFDKNRMNALSSAESEL